jgi:hypothetical protein
VVFTRGTKKEPKCRCDEVESRLAELERTIEQQQKWNKWRANADNTGGQFGFGSSGWCRDIDVQA